MEPDRADVSRTEATRLAALRSYAVLDTPAEPVFDRITALAKLVVGTTMATISLLDVDRQWFKSRQGVEVCETDRGIAFCDHALSLARGEVLVVPDTTADARFADNPMVTGEPRVRFYAGAVLVSPEGEALGTLCVMDSAPRAGLTPLQHETLGALAELVMAQLEVRRATRRERARREMLELAEQMSAVGHWRLDVATGRVDWSDEVFRIHGLDPATFDPTLDDGLAFYEEAERPLVAAHIEAALRERRGFAFQLHIRRPDGARRTVVCRAACELDPAGAVVAVFGVFQDVTEQEALLEAARAERERYRLLAENATDVIATYRPDGTLTYLSPSVERLLGRTPESLLGRTTFELIHPDDHARVVEAFRALVERHEPSRRIEYRALDSAGAVVWVEAHPSPTRDGEGRLVGFQDVVRDVSERKAMEQELQAARIEAEAAAQAKADFLANMSHELRTPLTSIVGFTDLAADQPELSPATRDYVRRVRNASQALLSTVNDILDFSKLEAGQVTLHPAPTDVAALARDAVELFLPQAGAKDLKLRTEVAGGFPAAVVIDGERLRQLLLNLVGNAVKFTAAGEVVVELSHADGRLHLAVRDTGCGISEADQKRLFLRFSQVDGSSTRQHGGTGLGLAICRALAEQMGGSVSVRSAPGRGSSFALDLPAERVGAAPSDAAGASRSGRLEGLHVLVVDDHASNRELARLILGGAGAQTTQAGSGEEALALGADRPFDAVLLDVRMPDMDGASVLRRLRSEGGPNARTPVLAYTADVQDARDRLGQGLGFDGFVGKPIDSDGLIREVRRAVRGAPATPAAAAGG